MAGTISRTVAPLGGDIALDRISYAIGDIAPLAGGGFVVMRIDEPDEFGWNVDIYAQRYDAAGHAVGAEIQVAGGSSTTEDSRLGFAALADGGFVLAWPVDRDELNTALLGRRYDGAGNPVGAEFTIAEHTLAVTAPISIAALEGGGFVITYARQPGEGTADIRATQIFGRLYGSSGAAGGEFAVTAAPALPRENHATAPLQGGGFVTIWLNTADGDFRIEGQRYDAGGSSVGGVLALDETSSNNILVAGLDGGGFVIAFGSTDGRGDGVFAHAYAANGTPQGALFAVNQATAGDQRLSDITALDGGGFIVTWEAEGNAYARLYDATASAVGSEFLVEEARGTTRGSVGVVQLADGTLAFLMSSPYLSAADFDFSMFVRLFGTNAFVNELSLGANGGIEIAGASGIELNGWSLVLYDAQTGLAGRSIALSGTIPAQDDGFGTLAFAAPELPAGTGGVALIDAQGGVLQFVSYGGAFAAIDGAAAGRTSADVGIAPGAEIQRAGAGETAADFEWETANTASLGTVNTGQDFVVNAAPVAAADTAATRPGGAIDIDVLGNDRDPEGGTLVVESVTDAANGTVTINPGGSVRYTPAAGFEGTDGFEYTVSDGSDGFTIAAVTVAVVAAEGPTALNDEILVNSFTTGVQANPAIAVLSGGSYVVAWTSEGQDGSGDGVYAQRYAANGTPAGAEFRVATTTANDQRVPSLASLSDGGFVVTWQGRISGSNGFDIYGQRYDADGVAQDGQFLINATTASFQGSSSVAGFPGGGFVISWHSLGAGETSDVYARRYNADGSPASGEFRVNAFTTGNQEEAVVATLAGGGFVVAWQSEGQDGAGRGVYAQRYDAAGIAVGGEFRANTTAGAQQAPALTALDGGGFVLVWAGDGIRAQIYDASGVPEGGEIAVATAFAGASVTALAGGGFVVGWSLFSSGGSGDGAGNGVLAQAFTAAGVALGETFVVNQTVAGDQQTGGPGSLVQLSDGSVAFVWSGAGTSDTSGVFLRQFDVGGAPAGPEPIVGTPGPDTLVGTESDDVLRGLGGNDDIDGFGGSDIAEYGGARSDYRVTLNNGVYTVDDRREASPDGTDTLRNVEYLRFGSETVAIADALAPVLPPSGHALAPGRLVNEPTETGQIMPMTVALAGGGYAIVWMGGDPLNGDDETLRGRVFAADGTPVGIQFDVGAVEFDAEEHVPSMTALAGGGFAVTWLENDEDLDDIGQNLLVQRYDALGIPVGPQILFGQTYNSDDPAITGTPDGGFVVIFEATVAGNEPTSLQRFDANGAPVGQPVVVTTRDGENQAAAVLRNGDIVVAWEEGDATSGSRIQLRLFDPAGNARGAAFAVELSDPASGATPSVTGLAGGGFVVTWYDGGANDDVYGRVFDAAGIAVGPTLLINENTAGRQWYGFTTALADGGFLVSWSGDDGDRYGVFGRAFNASGQPRGGEFLINPGVEGDQFAGVRNVAQLTDGSLVFSWTGDGEGTNGVFARRFGLDAAPGSSGSVPPALGGEALIAVGALPLIASLSGGGYVVAWPYASGSDGFFAAQVYAADGTAVGQRIELGTFQFASEENYPSLVGLAGGGFVLAWTAEETNRVDTTGVFRQFNADGTPVGPRVTLATNAGTYDMHAVAAPDGGYLVLFGENGQEGMRAQRFDANGNAVGSLLQFPNLDASEPGAAFLAGGNLAVANDPGTTHLALSIYSPAGNLLHSATLPSFGQSLSLAALDGGGLVVVWEEGGDVFGQVYDAQAVPQSGVFLLSTTTADLQDFPSVDSLSSGGFVVSWQSDGQDGSGLGLYARLFGANGQPSSPEFLVNQTTAGVQGGNFVNVTQLENDELVFTWWGSGNAGNGVYVRHFAIDPSTTPTTGDDVITGTGASDLIDLSQGGSDIVDGGGGSDGFYMGSALDDGDRLTGGPGGDDQVAMQGIYTGADAITLSAQVLIGIETLALQPGNDARFGDTSGALYSYDITLSDANVAANATLIVNANRLRAGENVTFDGSGESNGAFKFYMGAGDDRLTGGAGADHFYGRIGADTMTGGGGEDVFYYRAPAESTATARDTITDLTLGDLIDLSFLDANTANGSGNDAFAFIGDAAFSAAGQLRAVNTGDANWWIEADIDGDGLADLVIAVTVADGHAITIDDFLP
jgi:hypothetical protein